MTLWGTPIPSRAVHGDGLGEEKRREDGLKERREERCEMRRSEKKKRKREERENEKEKKRKKKREGERIWQGRSELMFRGHGPDTTLILYSLIFVTTMYRSMYGELVHQ